MLKLSSLAVAAGAVMCVSGSAKADWVKYYVSTDNLPTFTSGTYSGQANPNFGRLTVLYEHKDSSSPHWHTKGRLGLTGPALSPTVVTLSPAIQESQATTGNWTRLQQSNASDYGDFFGSSYHVSKAEAASNSPTASNFTFRSIEFLRGTLDPVKTTMLNSSSSRYALGIDPLSHVHLELVSVSDPDLEVFVDAESSIGSLTVGDDFHVGDSNGWEFTPILAIANANIVPNVSKTYTATFKLIDEDNLHLDSGNWTITVAVPEPTSIAGLGLLGAAFLRRRTR